MENSLQLTGNQASEQAVTGSAARSDRKVSHIRPARAEEISVLLSLFGDEVRIGRMLPRDPAQVAAQIGDWLVAEDDGLIVGCVSLVFFNEELCEVRSLAVHLERRGQGLGHDLIRAALDMAQARGMRRVLSLTRSVSIFERAGFVRDLVGNYPEKVWRDCGVCPFRERCDEVALIYQLELPGSGNGHKNGNGNGNGKTGAKSV